MSEWQIEEGVRCVVCPGCAFTFDATHTDPDGSYSCPNCGYPKREWPKQAFMDLDGGFIRDGGTLDLGLDDPDDQWKRPDEA